MKEYGIKIKIELPEGTKGVWDKIQEFFNSKPFDITISGLDKTFEQTKKQLTDIKKQVDEINKSSFEVYKPKMSSTDFDFSKQARYLDSTGKAYKVVTDINEGLGHTKQIIEQLDRESGIWVNTLTKTTFNKDTIIKAQHQLEQFKALSNANITDVLNKWGWKIDASQLEQFKQKLNSLTINENLPHQIKMLDVEFKNIINDLRLQETLLKELERRANDLNKLNDTRRKQDKQIYDGLLETERKRREEIEKIETSQAKAINNAQEYKNKLLSTQKELLNNRFQNALSLEVKTANVSPESEAKLLKQLNKYKNIIKSFQGKVNLGIELTPEQLTKLQNIENRIKRFYETIKISEKDSQGFNFAKFDAFNMDKLNKSIIDVRNSEELKNKALLQGHKLLDASISKTDQYIKVNQRLLQGNEVKNISVYIDRATGKIYQFSEANRDLMTRTYTMSSAFKTAFEKISLWAGATGIFYGISNAAHQAWIEIVNINTQLTELSKVLNNETNWLDLMKNTIISANYFSRSINETLDALEEYAKQGYEAAQATTLANSALLGANVTGMKTAETANFLTGVLAQFSLKAEQSSRVIDKLNEVDNNFAVTSYQLAASLLKAGEAGDQYGATLDELIGYTTAIGTATRESGKQIGNMLKTTLSRINMSEVQKGLKDLNIVVNDVSGDIRPVGDIYADLAAKWDTLTRAQKMNISVLMAGRFHVTRFMALMDNFALATDAATTSQKSLGSAIEENYKHQRSLQAQIARLTNSMQEFAFQLGENGVSGAMKSIMSVLTQYVKGLTEITTSHGSTVTTIGILILTIKLLKNKYMETFLAQQALSAGMIRQAGTITTLQMSFSALSASITAATVTIRSFLIALASNPITWIFTAITVIPMILGYLKQLREEQEMLNQKYQEANEKLIEMKKTVETIGAPTVQDISDLESQIKMMDKFLVKLRMIEIQKKKTFSDEYGNITTIEAPVSSLTKEERDYLTTFGIDVNKLNTVSEAISEVNRRISENNVLIQQAKQNSAELHIKQLEQAKSAFDNAKSQSDLVNEFENLSSITNKNIDQTNRYKDILNLLKLQYPQFSDNILKNIGLIKLEILKRSELTNETKKAKEEQLRSDLARLNSQANTTLKTLNIIDSEINKLKELKSQRDKLIYNDDTFKYGITPLPSILQNKMNEAILKYKENKRKEIEEEYNTTVDNAKKINDILYGNPPPGSGSSDSKGELDIIKQKTQQYEQTLESLDSQIKESQAYQELYNKTSFEYRNELEWQIKLLKQKQEQVHLEANALRELRDSGTLNEEQLYKVNLLIAEMGTNYNEFQKKINDLSSQNALLRLEGIFKDITNTLDPLKNKIETIKKEMSTLDNSQVSERIDLMKALSSSYTDYTNALQKSIDKLEAENNFLNKNSEAFEKNSEEIKKLNDELRNTLIERKYELQSELQSVADEIIQIYKDVYEKQKEVALDAIDKQIDVEEKRHEQFVENLEKEQDLFEENINKRIKLIEEEADVEDYQRDLKEKQDKRAEIQKQIDVLSLDDSVEAKYKISELSKELAETDKDIEDMKMKHTRDLRKKNLQDQLDSNKKQVENKKKTEEAIYNSEKESLQKIKDERSKYYDNLINDEAKFLQIRREILNGNLSTVQNDFASFSSFLSNNMTVIGESLSANLINRIGVLPSKIRSIRDEIALIMNEMMAVQMMPLSVGGGRVVNSDGSINIPEKSGYDNTRIGSDGLTDYTRAAKNELLKSGSVVAQFHDGGIVGEDQKTPPRIVQLANKLLNTKNNEQVIKALQNEIYTPPQNITKNFIPNLQNLINSIIPQPVISGVGDTIYNLNLRIDNVTGDKKGGQTVFSEIVKAMKTMGNR